MLESLGKNELALSKVKSRIGRHTQSFYAPYRVAIKLTELGLLIKRFIITSECYVYITAQKSNQVHTENLEMNTAWD